MGGYSPVFNCIISIGAQTGMACLKETLPSIFNAGSKDDDAKTRRRYYVDLPASQIPVLDHEEVDSTNSEAKRLVDAGRDDDFVVSAARQTAGRGRFRRAWHATGETVAMTISVRRPILPVDFTTLPLMTGVALHRTLAPLLKNRAALAIKWPNDILVDDAKLSGTLIEADANRIYVGIGINLGVSPGNVIYPTAHLHAYVPVPRETLIRQVADVWYAEFLEWSRDGFRHLGSYYDNHLWRRGSEITLFLDEARTRVVKGRCEGVDASGRLILQMDDGTRSIYSTGDVGAHATLVDQDNFTG